MKYKENVWKVIMESKGESMGLPRSRNSEEVNLHNTFCVLEENYFRSGSSENKPTLSASYRKTHPSYQTHYIYQPWTDRIVFMPGIDMINELKSLNKKNPCSYITKSIWQEFIYFHKQHLELS